VPMPLFGAFWRCGRYNCAARIALFSYEDPSS
jgi:hypothetical protein